MEHSGIEQKGLLVFLRSKGVLRNWKGPQRADLGFGAITVQLLHMAPDGEDIGLWVSTG